MSGRRAVIVGAGHAGLAAAWAARRGGWEVTVVSSGPGASALGNGAIDDAPWEDLLRAARLLGNGAGGTSIPAAPLAATTAAFASELDLWDAPRTNERPWIATVAGRARPTRCRDRSLLDLGALAGVTVLVPRADRAGWDADAIAAALERSELARARRLAFCAVDVSVLRYDDEHRAADAELAARHDDEDRIAWLAGRLRERVADAPDTAVLLGPWLGAQAARAPALSQAVGRPCGEALVGVGSPAGLRFEAARDRLLDRSGAKRVTGRVSRVFRPDGSATWSVVVTGGATLSADAVVLAVGGLAGGGLVYTPPERGARADIAPAGKVPFELSLDAPVVLSAGGGRMEMIASMHGPELDAGAWPSGARPGALESVGVRCEGTLAAPDLYCAGDALAGRPRTVLEAVASGLAAGAALSARA